MLGWVGGQSFLRRYACMQPVVGGGNPTCGNNPWQYNVFARFSPCDLARGQMFRGLRGDGFGMGVHLACWLRSTDGVGMHILWARHGCGGQWLESRKP